MTAGKAEVAMPEGLQALKRLLNCLALGNAPLPDDLAVLHHAVQEIENGDRHTPSRVFKRTSGPRGRPPKPRSRQEINALAKLALELIKRGNAKSRSDAAQWLTDPYHKTRRMAQPLAMSTSSLRRILDENRRQGNLAFLDSLKLPLLQEIDALAARARGSMGRKDE